MLLQRENSPRQKTKAKGGICSASGPMPRESCIATEMGTLPIEPVCQLRVTDSAPFSNPEEELHRNRFRRDHVIERFQK